MDAGFQGEKIFEIIIESFKFCMQNKGFHIFGYVIMLANSLSSDGSNRRRHQISRRDA